MLALFVLFIFSIISYVVGKKYDNDFALFLSIMGGAVFIIGIFLIPVTHIDINSMIVGYDTVAVSVQNARENRVYIESATLQIKIVETNQSIARMKYYNSTIFGLWIPDAIDKLELIK